MTTSHDSDFLRQSRPTILIPDPTRRALDSWLAELPLANVEYCVEAVEAVLGSFNSRPDLPPTTRLEMAEPLRPMLSMLIQQSERRFLDSALPYPPELQFSAKVGLRLHSEMATAYALAAVDPKCSDGRPKGEQRLLGALYRAFQHLGYILLGSAQNYTASKPQLWPALYRLYHVAEAHNLLQAKFEDPENSTVSRVPLSLFKQTLLFSLTNTLQLRQRQMKQVFELLGEFADHALLESKPVLNEWYTAEFFINLDQNHPPARVSAMSIMEAANSRFLFTERVIQALANLAKNAAETRGTGKAIIDTSVLLRVAKSLGEVQRRKSPRRLENGTCDCMVGLNGLIGILALDHSDGPPMGSTGALNDASLVPKYSGPVKGVKVQERIFRSEAAVSKLYKKRNAISSEEIWGTHPGVVLPGSKPGTVVKGKIVNSSAQAYCIALPADQSTGVKVGELIGVWTDQSPLSVGTIRWLQCGEDNIRIGVELFSPSAKLAELVDRNWKPCEKGIFLPAIPHVRSVPELLSSPGPIRSDYLVCIREQNQKRVYQVQSLLEGTSSFNRSALVELAAKPG